MSEPRWRVGKTLGRTLYREGRCIGMVDSPELAADIVAAMNAVAPNRIHDREHCPGCAKVARHPGEGYACAWHPAVAP